MQRLIKLVKLVGHSVLIIRKPDIRAADERFFGEAAEVLSQRNISQIGAGNKGAIQNGAAIVAHNNAFQIPAAVECEPADDNHLTWA